MYTEEIKIAIDFINKNKTNTIIHNLLSKLRGMWDDTHSNRWSYAYDVIYDNFPRSEVPREVVTGLVYLTEDYNYTFVFGCNEVNIVIN